MAQHTESLPLPQTAVPWWVRAKPFLLNNGPLLTTITIFILGYFISGRVYPAMQKPQVFFNLFINNASLLIISIGMIFRGPAQRHRPFGGIRPGADLGRVGGFAE